MEKEQPQPVASNLTFNLIIDKDRCHILQALQNLPMQETGGGKFFHYLAKKGLIDCYDAMMDEVSDKRHERDWCIDPNCDYKKNEEEDDKN